ncbi:hypothetical protein FD41_GL000305 [Lentilactobacillus farraginis DSM 18382 = JCM 14108]|uniref:Uncharacterized protein n=1 Tax=Lentilactobacillus farraginis DSM 18382 = JCM 14108 TaxID=1423743 RepID=A0A0R1VQU7_9LACO|nr:hypothetical protein FD41_GL000305 [Lentilactobacillus farraginis DSM 18382 = JCM 14108]
MLLTVSDNCDEIVVERLDVNAVELLLFLTEDVVDGWLLPTYKNSRIANISARSRYAQLLNKNFFKIIGLLESDYQ